MKVHFVVNDSFNTYGCQLDSEACSLTIGNAVVSFAQISTLPSVFNRLSKADEICKEETRKYANLAEERLQEIKLLCTQVDALADENRQLLEQRERSKPRASYGSEDIYAEKVYQTRLKGTSNWSNVIPCDFVLFQSREDFETRTLTVESN